MITVTVPATASATQPWIPLARSPWPRFRIRIDDVEPSPPVEKRRSRSVPVPDLRECLGADGESCRIPLAGGGSAVIDAEDHEKVASHKWHLGGTRSLYPVTKSTNKTVYLHRLVMDAELGEVIDHKDGNRLNARKSNLRRATRSQNGSNRSFTRSSTGYRGVWCYPSRKAKPYKATVVHQGVTYRGPYRATAAEAGRDFDELARPLHGAYGSYNFPRSGERRCRPVGNGGIDG